MQKRWFLDFTFKFVILSCKTLPSHWNHPCLFTNCLHSYLLAQMLCVQFISPSITFDLILCACGFSLLMLRCCSCFYLSPSLCIRTVSVCSQIICSLISTLALRLFVQLNFFLSATRECSEFLIMPFNCLPASEVRMCHIATCCHIEANISISSILIINYNYLMKLCIIPLNVLYCLTVFCDSIII